MKKNLVVTVCVTVCVTTWRVTIAYGPSTAPAAALKTQPEDASSASCCATLCGRRARADMGLDSTRRHVMIATRSQDMKSLHMDMTKTREYARCHAHGP
jgi:hypothetical protein